MQIVERALKELKKVFFILYFGNRLLDSLLILMFFLVLSLFFKFSWFYAVLPAAAYFIVISVLAEVKNHYVDVEDKVPELKEQLRTAADNVYRTNPIVDSLKEDVVRNMRKIKTSYFIDEKKLGIKLIVLCGLAFLIVFLAFLNVDFAGKLDFGNLTDINPIGIRGYGQEAVRVNFFLSEGNLSDVLGNKTIAELGNKELYIGISPLQSDTDLNIIEGSQAEEFNNPQFPKEIYTSYDVSYNEKITKENQKVVKNYFDQIIR